MSNSKINISAYDLLKGRNEMAFFHAVSNLRTEIMGLAMLSVMLFHQYFTSIVPFNVFHNFGNWGVDVFLFLSGMGLVHSLEKNPFPIYFKRRFKRIIPSCILCGTVKYIVFLLFGSSLAILKDDLKIGWWSMASFDLWFIPTILILYIISPLLHRILYRWPAITLIIISFSMLANGLTLRPSVGFSWTSPEGVLSHTIERLPVFAIGMFIAIRKGWIDNKIPYSMIFLIIALGIRLLIKSNLHLYGAYAYIFLALAFGVPALITTNILLLRFAPPLLKRCIVFLGEYSLELYLVHEFIYWSMKVNFIDTSPILLLPIWFILSCIAAYLCKLTINKFLS